MKNIKVLDYKNAPRCDKCKLPMRKLPESAGGGARWSCDRCNIIVTSEGPYDWLIMLFEVCGLAVIFLFMLWIIGIIG